MLFAIMVKSYAQGLPPKESTVLDFLIEATSIVNQDPQGNGLPIQVKIFELKDASSFGSADFVGLMTDHKITLAADALVMNEYVLRPNQKAVVNRKSHPQTVAIGIVAGYKDLANSEWRVVVPLKEAPEAAWYRFLVPANKLKLDIKLEDKGIKVLEK